MLWSPWSLYPQELNFYFFLKTFFIQEFWFTQNWEAVQSFPTYPLVQTSLVFASVLGQEYWFYLNVFFPWFITWLLQVIIALWASFVFSGETDVLWITKEKEIFVLQALPLDLTALKRVQFPYDLSNHY